MSLLNFFFKIFEKAMKHRLLKYLEENTILPSSLYGFRENVGAEDSLAQLSRNIYTNIEENKKTLDIFMGLNKVFDSISHNLLLNSFQSIGIVKASFNLLKSYLQHRKQQVKIANTLSNKLEIDIEVPQGTVR